MLKQNNGHLGGNGFHPQLSVVRYGETGKIAFVWEGSRPQLSFFSDGETQKAGIYGKNGFRPHLSVFRYGEAEQQAFFGNGFRPQLSVFTYGETEHRHLFWEWIPPSALCFQLW